MTDKEFEKIGIKGTRRYKKLAKIVYEQMIDRRVSFNFFLETNDYNKLMKLTGYIQWLSERAANGYR